MAKVTLCMSTRRLPRLVSAFTVAALTVALAVVLAGPAGAAGSTGDTAAAAAGAPSPVIVLARNPRGDASRLLAEAMGAGATHVKRYRLVSGFAATVPAAVAARLAADPAVASVVPDGVIRVPVQGRGRNNPSTAPSAVPSTAGRALSPGTCPTDPKRPILEPEALASTRDVTTRAGPGAQALATGRGVKVGWIADGIDVHNPDFIRPDGSMVFVDYKDFSGQGPDAPTGGQEAFGDASSIAAQGRRTYDLANFVNPAYALPKGCTIRVLGMAPGASLVGFKAGGELMLNSAILQAIDYAVTVDRVDVLNESFGGNVYPDNSSRDTVQRFNDAAVAAGVTVTASTGDAGITGTIVSPSTDPLVISAGATTDNRLYEQTGYAAARFSNGRWVSDNISALSSGGISQGGRTMDLVAPGEGNWAVCTPDPSRFTGCVSYAGTPASLQSFGGTSESAPLTAGAAALVIQAYRGSHGGVTPSPRLVKQLLTSTAHDLRLPAEEQGAGLLDARAAVEAALTVGNGTTPDASVADNVLVGPEQLDFSGGAGTSHHTTVSVTNVGRGSQTVTAARRTFVPAASDTRITTSVDAASSATFPYYNGIPWVAKKVHFTVQKGVDRLGAALAWPGAPRQVSGVNPIVRLTLLGPDGTFYANTRPQGGTASANFGFLDVRNPPPGRWTGILYTPSKAAGPTAAGIGFTGMVRLDASFQKAVTSLLRPAARTLAPGATGTFVGTLHAPASGGDASRSVVVTSSGGHVTSVPVILRALVATNPATPGRFSGTITGGNARAFSPGETFTYAFDVPAGQPDVTVGIMLPKNPLSLLSGVLIAPNGEVRDSENNVRTTPGLVPLGYGRSLQTVAARPESGQWRLVLIVQNPVSGLSLRQSFAGTVKLGAMSATAPGVPNDPSVTLKAGVPLSATIRLTNGGSAVALAQVDARLDQTTALSLVSLSGTDTVHLPLTPEEAAQAPEYLVPPATTGVVATATSTRPAQLELQGPSGEPDVFGDLEAAKGGSLVSTARDIQATGEVAHGLWFTVPALIGPFPGPAPTAAAVISAAALTKAFDRTVTCTTEDPWLVGIGASTKPGRPIAIAAGATGRIGVTITPTATKGTVVRGVLYVVTSPFLTTLGTFPNQTGAVLAAVPYSYTVG